MAPKTPFRFSRIRHRLDPCCDYLVFETECGTSKKLWSLLRDMLQPLRAGILEQRVRNDRLSGRSQLVVKLDPRKGESVKRAILNMRLTPEVVIYVYNRHRASGTDTQT